VKLSEQPKTVQDRKRLGRGSASGQGTSAGRGTKGQRSRAGGRTRPGFEGGQMPLVMRTPKRRGFTSRTPRPVGFNFSRFADVPAGTVVTLAWLKEQGWIGSEKTPVKLLGDGDVPAGVTFDLPSYSKGAEAKLAAVGGAVKKKALIKLTPPEEPETAEGASEPQATD
jgi:large subunit ribosomal protein L15